ncbi:glial cell line-derived neurotrophic factor-like [Amia ocellicauda]|uniref:glial cell line-derived neurotrophic factor-like n=1 Tax=Amia ocellicauda TaxID=2972642 RepID=UPI003464418C|nr:GDNF factor [Amia calva]
MKLWDVLAMCLLLLNAVSTSPLFNNWQAGKRSESLEQRSVAPSPLDGSESGSVSLEASLEEEYDIPELYPEEFEDVVDFIQATIKRLKRSPEWEVPSHGKQDRSRQRASTNTDTGAKRARGRDRRGKNRGCILKEIHLNVTDLDLGYKTKEELIFRYCSGSCSSPETTYDLILKNLTRNKKLVKEKVKTACCRPTSFDDDLSFLDDSLVYHTLKKHSARKCGCV